MPVGSKNRVIAGCGMHHVALQTRDWDASLRLYQDVLGMSVAAEFGTPERKIVLLDMGDGSHMELFQPTAKTPPVGDAAPHDPYAHVALATTDARAAIEHIRRAGYPVTVEPKDVVLGTLRATIAFLRGRPARRSSSSRCSDREVAGRLTAVAGRLYAPPQAWVCQQQPSRAIIKSLPPHQHRYRWGPEAEKGDATPSPDPRCRRSSSFPRY